MGTAAQEKKTSRPYADYQVNVPKQQTGKVLRKAGLGFLLLAVGVFGAMSQLLSSQFNAQVNALIFIFAAHCT
jgi:hypothetical protein